MQQWPASISSSNSSPKPKPRHMDIPQVFRYIFLADFLLKSAFSTTRPATNYLSVPTDAVACLQLRGPASTVNVTRGIHLHVASHPRICPLFASFYLVRV